MGRYVKWIVQ